MTTYDALLVDPDVKSRNNLKTVTTAVTSLRKSYNANTLSEAWSHLVGTQGCDIIFFNYKLGKDEITKFIARAKECPRGEECTFIIVLASDEQDNATIAGTVLMGAHGVLCHPYSADRLKEIAELATKVKGDCANNRKKVAIQMLLNEVIKEYDKLATYIARGFPYERAKKKFADKIKSLQSAQGEAFDSYIGVALDFFEKVPPPAPKEDYKGGSKRVKDKLEAKLREQFERECAEADANAEKTTPAQ